ncbi:MAG TPA: chemotaxis protein CheB [Ktedonobacteraceae bacterium]
MIAKSGKSDDIPVVCIGLSAGGIKPVQELFRALSPQTGMAFVVIHHLRKEHPTLLPGILSKCTEMKTDLARSGMSIEPNHVYVIPSGAEITVCDSTLEAQPRTVNRGWSNVVTLFLASLTQSSHPGIAVILSGMDKDGAAGLKDFKQHGGVTIAQAPGTAMNPEMPDAAIRTGAIDYVLPPEAIATQLEKIAADLDKCVACRVAMQP